MFGAVLIAGRPSGALAQFESPGRQVVFGAIALTIALSVNSVVYTGWAAAGLPKMLVDVTGATLFYEETRHAARSLARLRVGLICGAPTATSLSVAAVAVLSTGVST